MKAIQIDSLTFTPFIDRTEIQTRVTELGHKISADYRNKQPVFIGVLNGCFMFMSDLLKNISISCEMSFVKLASYEGLEQGNINQLIGVGMDLKDRHVIVVEDVIDSGNSIKFTVEALGNIGVSSISICTLLIKPACLQHDIKHIDYIGFEIDPEFVIGYGLDYNGLFRNLPDIYRESSVKK